MKEFKDTKYGDLTGKTYKKSIDVSSSNLTSLKGSPKVVRGNFNCWKNKLPSLEGGPEVVKGYFSCAFNELPSLEGAPKVVEDDFSCWKNKLPSLKGGPKVVGGNFDCENNELKTLEGLPEKIGGDFNCKYNPDLNFKNSWEYIFKSEIKGKINVNFKLPTKEDYELYHIVKGNMKKFWEIYDMKEMLK